MKKALGLALIILCWPVFAYAQSSQRVFDLLEDSQRDHDRRENRRMMEQQMQYQREQTRALENIADELRRQNSYTPYSPYDRDATSSPYR